MKLSFTYKVFIAILGMILLISGGVVYFFELEAGKIADAEINRRLQLARDGFQNFDAETRKNLRTINTYISKNANFLAYMAAAIDGNSPESIKDQFEEIRAFSDCDFMVVIDAEGETVVDTSGGIAQSAGSTIVAYLDAVDEGLDAGGDNAKIPFGTLRAMNHLYNAIMSPIMSGGFFHGYVMVGYQIDDADARKIGRVTNCDILFFVENDQSDPNLVASYFEGGSKEYTDLEMAQAQSNAEEGSIFEFSIRGNRYKGLMGKMKSLDDSVVGRYITIKSLRRELESFRNISKGLLLIGFIAILVISPLSIAAARGVTKPVNHLVANIEKVQQGQYDENQIEITSGDEIGKMASSFKAMVKELREQRELIQFMEQSAGSKSGTVMDPDQTVSMHFEGSHHSTSMMANRVREAMEAGDELPKGFILGGRYQLMRVLGRGGMGIVYLATDRSLDEIVAIKMLHVNSPQIADMLKHETKLARKITHRNIIRIYDFGELEGVQFVSMEYVKGTTVKGLLKRVGRLPLGIGLRISKQVCEGLEAAHEQGVIHGDIKPENVILNARGEIKIMDFGVARASTVETGQHRVSGTPSYMSPEQFQGKMTDQRADIYSLGIMMFEFFAGHVPFTGKTLVQLLKHHLTTQLPNLARVNMELPIDLVKIVQTATQKDPDDRFLSTGEMLAALREIE